MELKLDHPSDVVTEPRLLIEPYGIETSSSRQCCLRCPLLLIEPYGIETR